MCYAVGMINTVATMPFDVIKTQAQKYTTINQKNNLLTTKSSTSTFSVAAHVWKQHGLRGFFIGSKIRFFQYIINAALTVPTLDYLESWKNKRQLRTVVH